MHRDRFLDHYFDDDPDPDPEPVTVRYVGGYRPDSGEFYEWGVEGSPEVWGNFIDPAVCPPAAWDETDTDGHLEVWVRPCSYTASLNAGGLACAPREYRRRYHERAMPR